MVEIESKIGKATRMLENHAAALAFLFQISQKDVAFATASGNWAKLDLLGKAEFLVDVVGGRTVGVTLFPAVANFAPVFNIGNAINSTSKLGALLWITHQIGFASDRIGRLGASIALGGVIGGIFDDPIATSTSLQGNFPVGNYSTSARTIMVSTGTPWTTP